MKNENQSPIPQWKPKTDQMSQVADIAVGSDEKCFQISFRYYKEKMCEISYLEKNRARETLKVLKTVGQSTINTLKDIKLDRLPVRAVGEYARLFKGLPPDFDVFEHKTQGDSRLFYSSADNLFFVILIKNNHFDTSKNR